MERRNDLQDQIEHEQLLIATLDKKLGNLQEHKSGSHDPSPVVPSHVITQ